MVRYARNDLGHCDFLDVLEESVLMHARLHVELLDGTRFDDELRDVITRDGVEEAIFANHEAVQVREIAAVSREPLTHTYPRDPRRDPTTPGRL